LRSFQDNLDKFTARGVRVVAVSVDPPDITQKLREQKGYTFLFLSDTKGEVTRGWDLLHPHAGIDGADIARPAEFLIDPAGKVRWTYFTTDYRVRVHAPAVLKALDELHAGAPGGDH
jgi:peroxiredoxin